MGLLALVGGGVPLGAAEILLGAAVVYLGVAWPRLGRREVWLVLAGLAMAGALGVVGRVVWPDAGFAATYFSPSGALERAPHAHSDRRLDLSGDQFAVGFFNDAARFNFGPEVQPGRDQLPFSVRWTGALDAPGDGERRIVLEATGPATVWIDDAELLRTPEGDTRAQSEALVALGAGAHALRVEYTRPEARVPRLRLMWQARPGGALEVVGATSAGSGRLVADVALGTVLMVWLLLAARRMTPRDIWRALLGLLPVAFLVHGMLLQAPLLGRTAILSGLDDWLVYESSARDILLNGPLMTGGQEHAAPYYGQPLYPYVLAVAHWLTGEGLFGPLALQFAALGLVIALAAVLAHKTFGSRAAALSAVASLLVFVQAQTEYFKVARQLFNENLYMPLVMASLIVLVALARRRMPRVWWRMLLVGVLLGITTISRSQFLAFVPLALIILAVTWRGRSAVPLAALLVGMVLAIAPVTARNWIVSGQLVPISASGGASLLEFHRPPPGLVDANALQRDPLFEALRLDASTRTVLAFARQDPLGYFTTWLPLGAHALGLPGRTGGGVYWPLLGVVVLYLASFALRSVRRTPVWPIHAFIASDLLVLMLFEADTYGYRLVMPMYAPMLVVAAQVPLALVRFGLRWWRAADVRSLSVALPMAVAVLAGMWQVRSVALVWPERETNLVGLGGPAAHAAATADQTGADVVYVASVDGTPRRFGAGSLPGLRYPWLKWFDPARSVPLPADGTRAVYVLSELAGAAIPGELVECLGAPDASGERVLEAEQARKQCVTAGTAVAATFEGLARVDAVQAPDAAEAGEPVETRLVWQPLVRHPEPQQIWLHLEDADDGTQWGNATLDLYPARQWEPGETLLSRLPLATDVTAIPDRYRVSLGMNAARPNAPAATAAWQGQRVDRVPVGSLMLLPSTRTLAVDDFPLDMLPTAGVASGGLELVAARPPAAEALAGKSVRVGLLWRATQDAPNAAKVRLRLVRPNGDVVQESVLPVFGGRLAPTALRGGSVVRDEQSLELGSKLAGEGLMLEVGLAGADGLAPIGKISVAGRPHAIDTSGARPVAVFGSSMALLEARVEPERAKPGANVTVHLRWRADATMERTYKVFVHVLDRSGAKVAAQRDAEPLDGQAPTTGWVTGEVIEDEYRVAVPVEMGAGDYPIEIGVYEERSAQRLTLADGANHLVLESRLTIP